MLNEIDGVVCPEPKGAFYVYPSVKGAARPGVRRRHRLDVAPSSPS